MDFTHLADLATRPGLPRLLDALGSGNAKFVGGAVRDSLLGEEAKDLDLATPLNPYEVMRRCGAARIKTVPTGIEHGTVTAISDGQVVEITTLRADLATDGRHATVAFTDNWKLDAERRDFTINALYWDPTTGQLNDYFGGKEDLAAGRVRFIGNARQRIAEDHLRILRFFRFHARFGAGAQPDAEGLGACIARANDLMALSRERIADEWLKLLCLSDPSPTIRIMVEAGILQPVLPEIQADTLPRLHAVILSEARARIAPEPIRRFAALLPMDATVADRIAVRLKLSNKARKRLAAAVEQDFEQGPRALAYRVGIESAQDRLLLAGRSQEAAALGGWTVPKLPIGGGALIARGLQPGPQVARTLKQIEARWVAEGFPEEERFAQLVDEALIEHR